MNDHVRIPFDRHFGENITITPDIARQIVALAGIPALEGERISTLARQIDGINTWIDNHNSGKCDGPLVERIAALESGENIAQNTIDEMGRRIDALESKMHDVLPNLTPAEPFLGPAHQSELELAHKAGHCVDCGCQLHPLQNVRAISLGKMVCMPCWDKRVTAANDKAAAHPVHESPRLRAAMGDAKPAAQGDEAGDTDTEARAAIRGVIFKRFTVTTTDEMRVQIAYDIIAAIRRGEVPLPDDVPQIKALMQTCKEWEAAVASLRENLAEAQTHGKDMEALPHVRTQEPSRYQPGPRVGFGFRR